MGQSQVLSCAWCGGGLPDSHSWGASSDASLHHHHLSHLCYCNHKPICPSRTQSQQPCLWLPQSKPSSMVSPNAHPHLDEATPRLCKHPNLPLRGLIPSPSGVSDQPCAYRSPRSKRVDSASLTFLASTHVSLSPWQPLCSRPRQPSHRHQRQPPHRPACCYSAHPRPQSILNMAAKGNL